MPFNLSARLSSSLSSCTSSITTSASTMPGSTSSIATSNGSRSTYKPHVLSKNIKGPSDMSSSAHSRYVKSPSLRQTPCESTIYASSADEEDYAGDLSSDMEGNHSGRSTPSLSEVASTYSYSSTVDPNTLLREIHGRIFNNTSENYVLPADSAEHARLDMQHEMLKKKIGNILIRPDQIRRALAPRQDGIPTVLDVGCGSGIWTAEMARLFPHADVLGLDLAPVTMPNPPPNVRFECDDVNLGLDQYHNAFDVVHIRDTASGLQDYHSFLMEVGDILRPWGVFVSMEADPQIYDENFKPITAQNEEDEGFSWAQKIVSAARSTVEARGGSVEAYDKIPKWLSEMSCWESVGEKRFYIPIGSWEPNMDERQTYVSELMRQNMLRVVHSLRPALLQSGYFGETLDRWTTKIHDELAGPKKKMYVRWCVAWAIKKNVQS